VGGVKASLLQLGPDYSRVGRPGESKARRSRLALLFVPTLGLGWGSGPPVISLIQPEPCH
jgi:hypothetical protein